MKYYWLATATFITGAAFIPPYGKHPIIYGAVILLGAFIAWICYFEAKDSK